MKTVCVYHSIDLDGWMSAAIVKHWFITNNKDGIIFNGNTNPKIIEFDNRIKGKDDENQLTFIGYNYGQPIPDLSEYDQIIMCDISLPKEQMEVLHAFLKENFIWCDHHISAIKDSEGLFYVFSKGLRDTKFAACELTWKYFFPDERMPEIVRLLGRYDCFGHKGTSEEKKVLEFQYGARQIISSYDYAYDWLKNCIIESKNKHDEFAPCEYRIWESGKGIYGYLCTEAAQSYKNGVALEFMEPSVGDAQFGATTRKFICINKERFNPINFGIDYHADGYDGAACFSRRADGKWTFSLYNDNGKVDCSVIAKSFGGGGHKGASGFIVDDKGLLNILAQNNSL